MTSTMEISRAALLLVDMQRDLLHEDGALARVALPKLEPEDRQRLLVQWRELVNAVRQSGRPIVWVKTELRPDFVDSGLAESWLEPRKQAAGAFLSEGSWGAELLDELPVEPNDYVIVKKSHSAFTDTSLDRLLTNLGVEQCIVVGGGAEDAVAETARTGGRLGYEQFVVEDALYPPDANLRQISTCAELVNSEDVLTAATEASEPVTDERGPDYAMVLIDMQNDFMNNDRAHVRHGLSAPMADEKRARIIENTRQVAAAIRARGWPVIYVRVVRRGDNLDDVHTRTHRRLRTVPAGDTHCVEGTAGAEIVAELTPESGDFMVEKKGGSGFGYTPLHRILRNLNARRLLMTGGATTGCVWATVQDGVALGYDITVIGDATYPVEGPGLDMLRDWCAVRPAADVLEELAGLPTAR